MSYQATVLNVLIASPSDVQTERGIVRDIIHEWNATHSRSRKIILQPIGWETHSHPAMDGRPQGVINKQILLDADLVVAIFWTRMGTPTGVAQGGSVEELDLHMKAGKPAMVYFSDMATVPSKIETEQYKSVLEFKEKWCSPKGLLETYTSHEEFKQKFYRQLAQKLNEDSYLAAQLPRVATEAIGSQEGNRFGEEVTLSKGARTLLMEAVSDRSGCIIARNSIVGFQVSTNSRQFVDEGSARSQAYWQRIIDELNSEGLIKRDGPQGLYRVTDAGFMMADALRDSI